MFQAFREVKIRVQAAAKLSPERLGVDLMREALHIEHGPLTDKAAPRAGRDARSPLFAGAIGMFTNPASHRYVRIKAEEASELIL